VEQAISPVEKGIEKENENEDDEDSEEEDVMESEVHGEEVGGIIKATREEMIVKKLIDSQAHGTRGGGI
jgi:hypothetical protein